ncbi:MAG: aminoglycoside phosphotransferase family protein [Calditrichaeota bacterium]|nr:MAG: aminoglycoside phosphotransferase family protein [Calditrichota bacterium]
MIETLSNPKVLDLSNPVLNEAWLRQRFAGIDWGNGRGVPSALCGVKIDHVWEEEKRRVILYQLFFDGDFQQPGATYVGFQVAGERLEKEVRQVQKAVCRQPGRGPATLVWPEVNMVLLAFPNDRKMNLLDAEALGRWLRRRIRAGRWFTNLDPDALSVEAVPLRYVPGKRFTMLCRACSPLPGREQREERFIVKQLNALRKVRRLARYLEGLKAAMEGNGSSNSAGSPSNEQERFVLPGCLGLLYGWNAIAIEYLEGQNLKQLLPELDVEPVMYRLGQCLAHFHGLPFRVAKRVTPADELEESSEAVEKLSLHLPDAAPQARALLDWLRRNPPSASSRGLLHGSFRLNHVFLAHNRLALFDLDSLRWGPPAYDLANFLTSLYYLQAQGRIDQALRHQICRQFLAGYVRRSPAAISFQELGWYLVSLLLNKQAFKYVNHSHADREQKVLAMLAIGEQISRASLDKTKSLNRAWSALP